MSDFSPSDLKSILHSRRANLYYLDHCRVLVKGGRVDVADLVKDAVVLPQAFVSAVRGDDEQEFRQSCIEHLVRTEALDFMIETLQRIAQAPATA